jgi:hypothetical protein
MANLIRLKQIESSSFLEAAGAVGLDFSQSVIDIITTEVQAVLPDGVVSGSSQVIGILSSLNTFTASLGDTFATDVEVYLTASNIIDQGEW